MVQRRHCCWLDEACQLEPSLPARKALNIDVQILLACDKKPASFRCVSAHSHAEHFFKNVADVNTRVGKCLVHPKRAKCDVPSMRADMAVFGPPCQPHTVNRPRSGATPKTGPTEGHPLRLVMSEVLLYIEQHRPRTF